MQAPKLGLRCRFLVAFLLGRVVVSFFVCPATACLQLETILLLLEYTFRFRLAKATVTDAVRPEQSHGRLMRVLFV